MFREHMIIFGVMFGIIFLNDSAHYLRGLSVVEYNGN